MWTFESTHAGLRVWTGQKHGCRRKCSELTCHLLEKAHQTVDGDFHFEMSRIISKQYKTLGFNLNLELHQ